MWQKSQLIPVKKDIQYHTKTFEMYVFHPAPSLQLGPNVTGDHTTLIRQQIVVQISNCGKHEIFAAFLRTACEKHGYQLSTTTIIIPKLSIQSENIDMEMKVCDRHANEHWARNG